MKQTGVKLALISILTTSIYFALVQLNFGTGVSGAVSAGFSILMVQVVLEELGFYDSLLE
jgi:hypothetical protein